jgi:hypothetical protein
MILVNAQELQPVDPAGTKRSLCEQTENQEPPTVKKKWKGLKYKEWSPSCVPAQQKYKKPTEKELTEVNKVF